MISARGLLLVLALPAGAPAAEPFLLGVEYTESGLAASYAASGVRSAKTRLEAFAWGSVEAQAPAAGRHVYDWSCPDALVSEYQGAGIRSLQTYVSPKSAWASVSAADIMPKPEYLDDYAAFIGALVERYDGDGAGDMPGLLAPIRLWVVGGEWTGFWPSGKADDYIALLAVTRQAARAADAEARLGLIPFLLFDVFEGNVPTAQQIASRLADPPPVWRQSTAGMLKILDRTDLYDSVDLHSLGDYTELPPMLDWMRGQLAGRRVQRPIYLDDAFPIGYLANLGGNPDTAWPPIYPVTRAQYPAVYRLLLDIAALQEPAYSVASRWLEAENAAGTVKKVVTAAGEGAAGIQLGNTEDWVHDSLVFLRQGFMNLLGASGAMGMLDAAHPQGYQYCDVRSAGEPRPSFQNLRLLTALVDGFTAAERLAGTGEGPWIYRFTRPGGGITLIAWHEDGVLQMPGEQETPVEVEIPVPEPLVAVITSVTERGALPAARAVAASGGRIRLALTSTPVFIVPAGTQATGLTVPIVLSSSGLQGSHFTSELVIANRGPRDAVLALTYSAAFGGGSGTTFEVVPAGRQRVVGDAITYLRAAGLPLPASGNRGGTVSVRAANLAAASDVSIVARTTSPVPGGRAGLAYGSLPPARLLTGGATLWGLRQDQRDRSNVALFHAGGPADGAVTLRVTLHAGVPAGRAGPLAAAVMKAADAAGSAAIAAAVMTAAAAVPDVTLPPGGFLQLSGILGQAGLASGYARVERVGGTSPWSAYAVLNDQGTSDGSFVPPWPDGAAARHLVVPAVVETGAFTTELVLGNGSAVQKTLTLAYVTEAGSATAALALAPGEQRIVPDFVQSLRDAGAPGIGPRGPVYAGALFVTSGDGDLAGVFAGARTSTAGGGGRYGVFYPAAPSGVPSGGTAWIFGLRQDVGNRTNLALVNLGDVDGGASDLRVELFDGDTGLLATAFDVPALGARRWMQLDRVLTRAPGLTNAYARVTQRSGGNAFLAYAVVNDGASPGERTGDGSFVEMVPGE